MTNARATERPGVGEAADPFMRGPAALTDPGLGAAVWTMPLAGARGGRQAGGRKQELHWLWCQQPSHL